MLAHKVGSLISEIDNSIAILMSIKKKLVHEIEQKSYCVWSKPYVVEWVDCKRFRYDEDTISSWVDKPCPSCGKIVKLEE